MTVTTGLACSARFLKALPQSHNVATRAELWLAGSLRATFNMDPGSNIQVDRNNPIRLTAQVMLTEGVAVDPFGVNVKVVPTSAESLFSPFGSELILYRGITYSNGDVELIKLGVVGIETFEVDDTGTDLVVTVSGSDRMRVVQRAGFSDTYVIPPGTLITSAIQALVAASIPAGMTFNYNIIPSPITTGSTATVFQPGDDPAVQAIALATSIGAELYFDRNGDCTCLPVPDPTLATPVWSYDEGLTPQTSTNITKEVDRVVSRVNAPNYFIVIGQGTGVAVPVRSQEAAGADLDPTSPTYIYGPYGKVVAPPITSSLYTSVAQCNVAAAAALRLAQGTEEALTISTIPKPDHQVDDVIEVTRTRAGLVASTYVVDSFTLNMEPASALALTCRSVRIGTGFQPAPPPPTAPPLPPFNLQQGTTTQTTVTVTWTPAADATSWIPSINGIAQAPVTSASATFSGLAAATAYVVSIAAVNSVGQSVPTAITVTTSNPTGTNPPNAVTGLAQVGTATINSCVLGWTASAVDGTHDAASSYSVSGGGTVVVSGVTATITGLTSNTPYVFTVTAHNAGGDSVSNPTVTVQTAKQGGGGVPPPPAGAYVMNFPADFTLNSAGDYGQMMLDAVTKFQNSGNTVAAWVKIAPGTYTIKAHVDLGGSTGDSTLPIWWVGTAADRTKTIFTANNFNFDMVSNHIKGSQFEYLTFKGTGIDPTSPWVTGGKHAGHAFGSGADGVGLWASAIYNQSAHYFAGRMTQGSALGNETPRSVTGYIHNCTWSDVILDGPTSGGNATADFDFQSGLLLENIQHTGNRLDFYCVSGTYRNSTFTPMAGGGDNPGFELTTGLDATTGMGIGPFTVQNWTTNGAAGRILPAPLPGTNGYAKNRGTVNVTLDTVVMTDTTQGMSIGDTLNLTVVNSTLGTININPNFSATGTVDASNTYVNVNHGGANDHIVFGGASAPAIPTGLAASNVTSTSITWSWNVDTGATSYTPQENGVALSSQAGTSITRTGLTPNTNYAFAVSATGSGGTSNYCATVNQMTLPVVASGWKQIYETPYTETTASSSARQTPGTVNTSVGDLIVVGIQLKGTVSTSVSTVTDVAGNTYSMIEAPGGGTLNTSGAVWYTKATNASAINQISVTPAVSCTVAFDVVGFSGAGSLDVHTSTTAISLTPSSGTTTSTAGASELVIAVEGDGTEGPASNQVFVPATTITTLTDYASLVSGQHAHVNISWQVSGAAGTQSFTATDANSRWDCSIVTFTPAGGTTATIPPVPTLAAAANITQNSLDLNWTDSGSGTGTPTHYPVYKGSPPVLLATVSAPTLTYHVSGLTPSTAYSFQVSAANGAGESAKSTAITPTTLGSSGTSTLDTVVVLFFENHALNQIMGTATYLTTLANNNAQATAYTTSWHPSEPNYMAFLAAQPGQLADSNNQLLSGNSLIDLLEAKGLTWGGFFEGLGGQDWQAAFTESGAAKTNYYDNHHNPMAHMTNIYNGTAARKKCVTDSITGTYAGITGTTGNPLVKQLAAAGSLPNFSLWIPNVLHEMHQALPGTSSITVGDNWAAANIPAILSSPQFASNALLVLVFDEDKGTPLYCCFAGPNAKANKVSAVAHGHYDLLKTIEDGLMGVGNYLNANDSGATAMSEMLI